MDKLKKCPFCGSEAKIEYFETYDNFHIACSNDDCPIFPISFGFETEEETINAWNTRYTDDTGGIKMARYIDADKLIETIMKNATHYAWNSSGNYDNGVCRGLLNAINIIERFQTEDVAPVAYGKWLPDGISLKCSLCGKWFVIEQGDAEINFCINCGAKMEE